MWKFWRKCWVSFNSLTVFREKCKCLAWRCGDGHHTDVIKATGKHGGGFEFALTGEQGELEIEACISYKPIPNKALVLSATEVNKDLFENLK